MTQRLFTNPITRIVLGLLVCFAGFLISQNIAGKILSLTNLDKDFRNLFKGVTASVIVLCTYSTLFKFIEKRKISEMSTKGIVKNLTLGILVGAALQCLTLLVIYLNNGFQVLSVNPVSFIIIPLTIAFTIATFEEILIRGILFRIIEEKFGSYISLVISAIIFGALHLMNTSSSLISAICIAVSGGLLLGAAYMYSRSLWLPIAIHFTWNFMQSGIFGAITSGNEKTNSLLTTQITGTKLITGGEFGPEGTIQAMVFCLAATIAFMYLNIKKKMVIKPYWQKNNASSASHLFAKAI
ncbi:MAG: family intrarane metalloprotease protein [Ferruginibacter sp.]|nr:family intrarane metalloprotease protein [Ferruginibacter sp.]